MTNQTEQFYAVRVNDGILKPWESARVVSIHRTYTEASQDCQRRFEAGEKGVHVTTYESQSVSPIK